MAKKENKIFMSSDDIALHLYENLQNNLEGSGKELATHRGSFVDTILQDSITLADSFLGAAMYALREADIRKAQDPNTILQDLRGEELDTVYAAPAWATFILSVYYDELNRNAIVDPNNKQIKKLQISEKSLFVYKQQNFTPPGNIEFRMSATNADINTIKVQLMAKNFPYPIPYDRNIIHHVVMEPETERYLIICRIPAVQAQREVYDIFFNNYTDPMTVSYAASGLVGFRIWRIENDDKLNPFSTSFQVRQDVDFTYRIDQDNRKIHIYPSSFCRARIGNRIYIETISSNGKLDIDTRINRDGIVNDLGFSFSAESNNPFQQAAQTMTFQQNILGDYIINGRDMIDIYGLRRIIADRDAPKTFLFRDADIIDRARELGVSCEANRKDINISFTVFKKFIDENTGCSVISTCSDILIDHNDKNIRSRNSGSIIIPPYQLLAFRDGIYRIANDEERLFDNPNEAVRKFNDEGNSGIYVLPYFLRIGTGRYATASFYDMFMSENLYPKNVYSNSVSLSELQILKAELNRDSNDIVQLEDGSIYDFYSIDIDLRMSKLIFDHLSEHKGELLDAIPDCPIAVDVFLHINDNYILDPSTATISEIFPDTQSMVISLPFFTDNDIDSLSNVKICNNSLLSMLRSYASVDKFIEKIKPRIICSRFNDGSRQKRIMSKYETQKAPAHKDFETISVYDCEEIRLINALTEFRPYVRQYRGPDSRKIDADGNVIVTEKGKAYYKIFQVNILEFVSNLVHPKLLEEQLKTLRNACNVLGESTIAADFNIYFENTKKSTEITPYHNGEKYFDPAVVFDTNWLSIECSLSFMDNTDVSTREIVLSDAHKEIISYFVSEDRFIFNKVDIISSIKDKFFSTVKYFNIEKINGIDISPIDEIHCEKTPFMPKYKIVLYNEEKPDESSIELDININIVNKQNG